MAERRPKRSSQEARRTVALLRQLAEHIRMHASYVDKLADAVEKSGVPDFRVKTGNVYWALGKIRSFFSTQVIHKITTSRTKEAHLDHRILGDLHISLAELEGKMPAESGDEE